MSIIAANSAAAEQTSLRVTASTPDVDVKTRVHDRKIIKLPQLNYTLGIEMECADGQTPQSLLLSIADTHKRISGVNLQGLFQNNVTITVPGRQIAPLTVADFCVDATDTNRHRDGPVTINGALSAQAALLCANEKEEQMIYASLALDVTLHCLDQKSTPGN